MKAKKKIDSKQIRVSISAHKKLRKKAYHLKKDMSVIASELIEQHL